MEEKDGDPWALARTDDRRKRQSLSLSDIPRLARDRSYHATTYLDSPSRPPLSSTLLAIVLGNDKAIEQPTQGSLLIALQGPEP